MMFEGLFGFGSMRAAMGMADEGTPAAAAEAATGAAAATPVAIAAIGAAAAAAAVFAAGMALLATATVSVEGAAFAAVGGTTALSEGAAGFGGSAVACVAEGGTASERAELAASIPLAACESGAAAAAAAAVATVASAVALMLAEVGVDGGMWEGGAVSSGVLGCSLEVEGLFGVGEGSVAAAGNGDGSECDRDGGLGVDDAEGWRSAVAIGVAVGALGAARSVDGAIGLRATFLCAG